LLFCKTKTFNSAIIHPKFRGVGLGEFLVKETLSKVDAKVIEVLAVMARYNPFFEKAGMLRVHYKRDESSVEIKMRKFLKDRDFDFKLARSEIYCNSFFSRLDERDKKMLLDLLCEFADQPFVRIKRFTPALLGKVFATDCVYLCWANSHEANSA
jgi:hypothetical protein